MKSSLAIVLTVLLVLPASPTFFNYPSDMMNIPTTRILGNLNYHMGLSMLMATTPYGYKFNTDWFEEDASFSMGLHIPWNRLKIEFTWVQFTMVQGLGQYGTAQIKLRIFDDPFERFSKEFLADNPRLRILPSIAFGIRNIASNSFRYITPTGNDADYITNNSFFIVFSKYLSYRDNSNMMLTFGLGGREFVGSGKMRNAGFFFGLEQSFFLEGGNYLRFFTEYSSQGIAFGGVLKQHRLFAKIGLQNLQTVFNSLKENRGVEINVGIGYEDSFNPVFKLLKPSSNKTKKYKIIPDIFVDRRVIPERRLMFAVPSYVSEADLPAPIYTAGETVEEEVKVVKKDTGLQLKMKPILFASNSARILSESYAVLDKIVAVLNEYPDYAVIIEGHTDTLGSMHSNFSLSKNRAEAVKSYILKKLKKPSADSIYTFGFASKVPIASNSTDLGRKLNKRVDFYLFEKSNIGSEVESRNGKEKEISDELNRLALAVPKEKPGEEPVPPVEEKPKETPKKEVTPAPEEKPSASFEDMLKEKVAANQLPEAIKMLEEKIGSEKSMVQKLKLKKELNGIYYKHANDLINAKDIAGASKYFELTKEVPNSKEYEESYYILGQIEYNKENYQKSIDYFKKVLENYKYIDAKVYDNDDEAVFKIIACFIKLNNISAAKSLLEAFPNNYPESPLNEKVKVLSDKLK